MKKSILNLPDGSKIIDMGDCLIVIDKVFADTHIDRCGYMNSREESVPCKAIPFITRKGRDAYRVTEGDTHTFWTRPGSGDTSWNDWASRKPVNALYANAVRTSNGGGCWREIIIMPKGIEPVSSEQGGYLDEIDVN